MATKFLGLLLGTVEQGTVLLSTVDLQWRTPFAIAFGAVPGALCRYYLTRFCVQWFGTGFPYGTFIINLSGALVMGFFTTLVLEKMLTSPDLRSLFAVGFLGAYTTFSTYALDTSVLLHGGQWLKALAYWGGSAVLGLVSLELGSAIARRCL